MQYIGAKPAFSYHCHFRHYGYYLWGTKQLGFFGGIQILAELARIYAFLGEEPFKHDFEKVEQVTWEDDAVHGAKGLHDIRQAVRPIEPQWPQVLGKFAEDYGKMNFWWPENQPYHEVIYHWQP